jgi:hypothetical protein
LYSAILQHGQFQQALLSVIFLLLLEVVEELVDTLHFFRQLVAEEERVGLDQEQDSHSLLARK